MTLSKRIIIIPHTLFILKVSYITSVLWIIYNEKFWGRSQNAQTMDNEKIVYEIYHNGNRNRYLCGVSGPRLLHHGDREFNYKYIQTSHTRAKKFKKQWFSIKNLINMFTTKIKYSNVTCIQHWFHVRRSLYMRRRIGRSMVERRAFGHDYVRCSLFQLRWI